MPVAIRPLGSFALFALAAALLADCAGGGSSAPAPVPMQQAQAVSPMTHALPPLLAQALAGREPSPVVGSWSSDKAVKQAVYVSDPSLDGYDGAVCYYAATGGTQLGCLAGGPSSNSGIGFPEGSWVDAKHHLWAANGTGGSGSGQVTEYALPLTATSTPINTLYSTVENPSEGAFIDYVCGDKAGDIYATILYTGTVAVWKAGTQNGPQTSTLVDANFKSAGSPSLAGGLVACAVDRGGNLYVSGQYAVGSSGSYNYFAELDEFARGAKGHGHAKVLQKPNSDLYFPAGVALDKQDNLAWATFNLSDSGSSVCAYTKPYTGGATSCTSGFATGFHFVKSGAALWGGNTTVYPWYHEPQSTVANEIAYPGGGPIGETSGQGLITPVDASVNPAL